MMDVVDRRHDFPILSHSRTHALDIALAGHFFCHELQQILRMMDVVDRAHNFPILSHLRTHVLFPVGSAHFSGIFFLYVD